MKTLEDRLLSRIVVQGDCWIFTGSCNPDGYGNINVKGKTCNTHRIAYEVFVGPIPEGLNILHTCDCPPCINPDHLFPGTQKDNVHDMIAKGRQNFRCSAKLKEEHVHQIRELLAEDKYSMKHIGAMFDVDSPAIFFIKHGVTWGWLERRELPK